MKIELFGENVKKGAGEIRIREFVRDTVRTEWYAGSRKGALGTLRAGAGNHLDQASLLIALLRASSVGVRYVHGVLELPLEQIGTAGTDRPSSG